MHQDAALLRIQQRGSSDVVDLEIYETVLIVARVMCPIRLWLSGFELIGGFIPIDLPV